MAIWVMWGCTCTQTRYRPTCLERRSRAGRRLLRDRLAAPSGPSGAGPVGPLSAVPASFAAADPGRTSGTTGALALGGGAPGAGRVSPIFGLGRWGAGRGPSGGLVPPDASRGGPSGVWLNSVSDMRESPPRVLCRVHAGPGPAHGEGLEPSAVAFDPLMRSTGPSEHRVGAEGRYQVSRTDATRVRGQLRPEMTVGAGHGQCQDGRADVVFGLTTLPLPPDGEDRSSEHLLDPLLQLLTWHSEHLHLPITRCYLLLQRTLGFTHQG